MNNSYDDSYLFDEENYRKSRGEHLEPEDDSYLDDYDEDVDEERRDF